MSWGLRWASPSASTPTTDQVEGMNCIGPTARSHVLSASYWPASLSEISVVPSAPLSGGPKMPGCATPWASRVLPLVRPWSDSTRPIAATSCHERWQAASAELMTVSARWYAASAAAGMPEAEAVATARWASPVMPGATPPALETLAGASMASAGRLVPSGSVWSVPASASADPAPVVAMLAVQATERTASGTRAMILWLRPRRAIDLVLDIPLLLLPRTRHAPSARCDGRPTTGSCKSYGTSVVDAVQPFIGETTIPAGHDGETRSRFAVDTWPGPRTSGVRRPSTGAGWPARGQWAGDPTDRRQRRPLRAGSSSDPRGRELPGAGLQRGRRHAPVHPLRRRCLAHRRRRQRVRRPDLLVGADAPRPRPPRGAGAGRRGGHPRHVVRRPHGARGRAGRGDRGAYAGGAGPLRLLRHRGDHVGDPSGARLHRP